MPNELTPQRLLAVPGSRPGSPSLDLDEIQGDILIGLQKFFERFVFFEIKDVKAFKSAFRDHVISRITTTRVVHKREFELNKLKSEGKRELLPLVGFNVAFTKDGLNKLTPNVDLKDGSFNAGAKSQAKTLNDPVDGEGNPSSWLPQFFSASVDGVFLVTGGTEAAVEDETTNILKLLGASVSVSYSETGNVRPAAEKGHEHFGWLDGISQPGIDGLSTAFPGQRLLDPGFFVFGYGATTNPAVPWMKNGSFMVFRRLKQLVPEFEQITFGQAETLGMDPVLLSARLVGRWKSGAPLALTPSQDDTTIGPDPQHNNNFDFSDDQQERRCPFGAHIRKTNPRGDFLPEDTKVNPRRIIRAGIPFGPELSAHELADNKTEIDRGLMFVCYQTSVANQFEFLQSSWANNPGFIFGKTHPDGSPVKVGFDPIIGQNNATGRARTMDEAISNYPTGNVRSTLNLPQDFIIPTAAGYFFVPSINALKNDLT
jgi:Dyp-type peroxidase family